MELEILKEFLNSEKNLSEFAKEKGISATAMSSKIQNRVEKLYYNNLIDVKALIPNFDEHENGHSIKKIIDSRKFILKAIENYEQEARKIPKAFIEQPLAATIEMAVQNYFVGKTVNYWVSFFYTVTNERKKDHIEPYDLSNIFSTDTEVEKRQSKIVSVRYAGKDVWKLVLESGDTLDVRAITGISFV